MVDLDDCLRYNDNHDRAMTEEDIRGRKGRESNIHDFLMADLNPHIGMRVFHVYLQP